ncbi:MAG: AlpA family phage regulatory protein [Gammaproteobacteria bacterium]|nr:MAG: AlpA family phage regulatory protein [Gammaproteobacteria bacterium]
MSADAVLSSRATSKVSPPPVVLSRWVNERCPALAEILSAHDVARLTRRPCWVLLGLSLVGRFPKRTTYRGRSVGWSRSEVLAWMTRELELDPEQRIPRRCRRGRPHQRRLPLSLPPRRSAP